MKTLREKANGLEDRREWNENYIPIPLEEM